MSLNIYSYIDGITATIVSLFSLILGLNSINAYIKQKKLLLPWLSAFSFSMSFYFFHMINFYYYMLNGTNLDANILGILTFILQPIAIFSLMFITANIFHEKNKSQIILFTSILSIIYYILLFGFFEANIGIKISLLSNLVKTYPKGGILIILVIFSLMAIAITGFDFYKLSKKIEDKTMRIKMQCVLWASILFLIGILINSIFDGFIIIFGRVIFLMSILFYLIGLNPKIKD